MKKLLVLILAIGSLVCSAQNNPPAQPTCPAGGCVSPNLVYSTVNPYNGPAPAPYTWSGFIVTESTGGGTSGGNQPGYNTSTGTFMFGYTQATVAYNYALSTALKNSGMTWLGYNYSWEYLNQGQTKGTLSANVTFTGTNGTSLHSKNWTLGNTGSNFETISGTEVFANSLLAANISSFGLSFTGKDDKFWAGYYGPQVRNPSITVNYTFDACSTNPLSSPTCAGYAEAYKTQQCTANPLYDPSCPGYAAAYKTQQCAANALYDPSCPGYAQAYFNDQCLKDSLYDRNCEGYTTAYAIKYLVNLDPAVTTAINQQLTTTQETYKNDPARVTVVNTTVDSVLATPTTTSATSVSPASVTSVINQQPAPTPGASPIAAATAAAAAPSPPPPPARQEERAQEQKRTDGEVQQAERRSGGNPQNARKEVAEKAKSLARDASRANTMERQVATQGLLVGLIGYVPGFAGYQQATVPDTMAVELAAKYSKPTVDNQNAQRRLQGANDRLHREMVDSQYEVRP